MLGYCCVPCEEDAGRYASVIAAIAKAQGAPVFLPHLTLGTLEEAPSGLAGVIEALRGLVLRPTEIDGTDVFTKSFFVRFEATDALLSARERLEQLPEFHPGRAFDPHMSLCYGPPPAAFRVDPEVLALLDRPVRFDRLVALKTTLPVETYADVAGWTVTGQYEIPPLTETGAPQNG